MKKKKDLEKHRMTSAEERRKSLQIKRKEKREGKVCKREVERRKKRMRIEAREASKE